MSTPPVLHDEPSLLAVDKPAGLASTGRDAADEGCALALVERERGRRLWAVHQLDKDTSGVLLLTDKKAGVERWQRALAGGSKVYLAVAHGRPPSGRVEEPVGDKPAATDLRVLSSTGSSSTGSSSIGEGVFSLVRARLLTGRTHQIRVHLAGLGCPLVGERRYRVPPCERHPRHALHAWRVKVAGRVIEAPIPRDLVELCRELGLELP